MQMDVLQTRSRFRDGKIQVVAVGAGICAVALLAAYLLYAKLARGGHDAPGSVQLDLERDVA